ncbi:GNAT family N-acetyltransferase [Nocardia sp. NPDC057353]|uniref:GNAT family N-acetyltransferase n=1 Tax=Nocardia sp. NPDC057353 TaxID=3346104 RepID=UPI003625CF6C
MSGSAGRLRVLANPGVAMSIARFHLRPLGRLLRAVRSPGFTLDDSALAPSGTTVRVRLPRLTDAPAWRSARLRNREAIEPFWVSTGRGWGAQHTDRAWAGHWLAARWGARFGTFLSVVIEVDGQFAGQCELRIEPHDRRGETGIWLDAELAEPGTAVVAGRLVMAYVFDTLGLVRVAAPVSVDNERAARLAARLGFVREGRMTGYLTVGGQRRDHDLWAITVDSPRP